MLMRVVRQLILVLAAGVCLAAVPAFAADTAPAAAAENTTATGKTTAAAPVERKPAGVANDPLSAGNALTVFSSLILVLVIMLGLAWLLRRLQLARPGGSGAIQMVAQLPLGTREKVVLLRVGEQNILVGCSAAGVNRVHSWSGDSVPAMDHHAVPAAGFGAALQSVLSRESAR